jgi:hypothetical protein
MILAPLFLFFAAPSDTAETIMARVAENQDRAQEMRTGYVYHQSMLVRLQRLNGKFAREESSEFTVAPTPNGFNKTRTAFKGKYASHRRIVEYDKPGAVATSIDIDGALAESFSGGCPNDQDGKDGVSQELFPLTAKEQKSYNFHLEGTEDYRGIPVYRVTFEPKTPDDGADWAGVALIDQTEYQPVLVTTHLATKIPMLVRTLLGTNVEQLGFKVTYKKFDSGLWFPVTYGGEFRLRALFLYARRVGLSVQNSDFKRADVSSKIDFAKVEDQ